jgi:hypothetical protein
MLDYLNWHCYIVVLSNFFLFKALQLIFKDQVIVTCCIHRIIFALSFYIQQVYGDRGVKIKWSYLI